ncbi:MAG: T9SS C-terminal target domain-containing protein [Calditrichaeota bacterium]|nr:MAG: T9SS C-terminal target domain-containing protein [Calditrichota bacterium]
MKKFFQLMMLSLSIRSDIYAQNFQVLEYLKSISGVKTIAGQHNREPNTQPAKWTNEIYKTTGKYPALWSGDFLFQSENIAARWTMIYEAERQWQKGAVVQLLLHTCPPVHGEPCVWDGGVLSKLTNSQWNELISDGTTLNRNWKKRLDDISVYLEYLKSKGVEVLFRPIHEMNQSAFWWGGRPGSKGTLRLYQITHDYLTKEKGLTNLIWVWDVQDLSWDFESYNPGDTYWDIMAFDVYSDGYNKKWYDYILTIAKDKPIAIGECDKLPSLSMLRQQPRWTFFMAWAELVYSKNSNSEIRTIYNGENVITLDEMPGWKSTNTKGDADGVPTKFALEQNYPNPFNPTTMIDYQIPQPGNVSLKIFDLLGNEIVTLVNEYQPAGKYSVHFEAKSLYASAKGRGTVWPSSVYFYRLNMGNLIDVKKMMLIR